MFNGGNTGGVGTLIESSEGTIIERVIAPSNGKNSRPQSVASKNDIITKSPEIVEENSPFPQIPDPLMTTSS